MKKGGSVVQDLVALFFESRGLNFLLFLSVINYLR